MQGVATEYLSFCNGKALSHFDTIYGYKLQGASAAVYIGEEWDPIYIYGGSSYGNPYGYHLESARNGYFAQHYSDPGGNVNNPRFVY